MYTHMKKDKICKFSVIKIHIRYSEINKKIRVCSLKLFLSDDIVNISRRQKTLYLSGFPAFLKGKNMPDAIFTERLILTGADTSLAEARLQYYIQNQKYFEEYDPDVCDENLTLERQTDILSHERELTLSNRGLYYYFFLREDTDHIAGTLSFSNIRPLPRSSASFGYDLAHDLWGQGYAFEACERMLRELTETTTIHRIESRIRVGNDRSAALAEKLGFKKEGILREYAMIQGTYRDHILYSFIQAYSNKTDRHLLK